MTVFIHTPTVCSIYLFDRLGINVFLRLENLQPAGSFKIRGISQLCQHYFHAEHKKHFVCFSGGNAGAAVAYAAREVGSYLWSNLLQNIK